MASQRILTTTQQAPNQYGVKITFTFDERSDLSHTSGLRCKDRGSLNTSGDH